MYSDIQRCIINTIDEMQYTPPTLQFNNNNTDPYDCFTCPGGEKPDRETFTRIYNNQPLKELRQERNRRLAEVDWIFSSDYQIEDTLYKEWLAYRKALRDLPLKTEDPANPVWPEKPETPTGKTEGIQTPHFVATLMTENSQLRSKVTALERKSTKFELDIIDMKRRIQKVET